MTTDTTASTARSGPVETPTGLDPTVVASEVSRVRRFRQRVVAASYLGSAVALFAAEFVDPSRTGKPEELASIAIETPGRMAWGAVLLVISSALLVVGALGCARLVRGRGRRLAHTGAALSVLGALGHMSYATFALILTALPGPHPNRAEMVELIDRVDQSAAVNLVALPLILFFVLGMLILQIALVRGRIVPSWVLAPVGAAIVIEILSLGTVASALAKQSLALTAAAVVAARVWQLTQEQWINPPFVPTRKMLRR